MLKKSRQLLWRRQAGIRNLCFEIDGLTQSRKAQAEDTCMRIHGIQFPRHWWQGIRRRQPWWWKEKWFSIFVEHDGERKVVRSWRDTKQSCVIVSLAARFWSRVLSDSVRAQYGSRTRIRLLATYDDGIHKIC
jgi:hypothetical protein